MVKDDYGRRELAKGGINRDSLEDRVIHLDLGVATNWQGTAGIFEVSVKPNVIRASEAVMRRQNTLIRCSEQHHGDAECWSVLHVEEAGQLRSIYVLRYAGCFGRVPASPPTEMRLEERGPWLGGLGEVIAPSLAFQRNFTVSS